MLDVKCRALQLHFTCQESPYWITLCSLPTLPLPALHLAEQEPWPQLIFKRKDSCGNSQCSKWLQNLTAWHCTCWGKKASHQHMLCRRSCACEHLAARSWHLESVLRHDAAQRAASARAWYLPAELCFLRGQETKRPAEQIQGVVYYPCTILIPLPSYLPFRNPCYEPCPLPLGSLL